MTEHFLVTCFLVGVSAGSGVGPVFLLTLNRSTLYGFWKGFATALGAALADALYFFLATFGLLSIVESMGNAVLFMEGLSGVLLMVFGVHLMRAKLLIDSSINADNQSLVLSTVKSFFLTLFNPFMVIFFVFVSVHILPTHAMPDSYRSLVLGGVFVGGGSLSILTLVALLGSVLGSKIKRSALAIFSKITGLIVGGFGVYLLVDFITKLLFLGVIKLPFSPG